MSEVDHSKVIILGSGPAGYTAAVYAARASLSPTLVTGIEVGGQLSITTDVENYPGFADAIQGPWLMEQMHAQAEKCAPPKRGASCAMLGGSQTLAKPHVRRARQENNLTRTTPNVNTAMVLHTPRLVCAKIALHQT